MNETDKPSPDWRPRPDPTLLTTAALEREIATLEKLLTVKLAGEIAKLEARLMGMDRALILLQTEADKMPEEVETKIAALKETVKQQFASVQIQFVDRTSLYEELKDTYKERFAGVQTQFTDQAKLYQESTLSGKEAISAALQAAKEAVNKSEVSTKEQLAQLSTLIGSLNATLNEKIDASTGRGETAVASLRAELLPQITGERARGDRGEGRQMGQGQMIAIIFAAITAMGVLVSIIVVLTRP